MTMPPIPLPPNWSCWSLQADMPALLSPYSAGMRTQPSDSFSTFLFLPAPEMPHDLFPSTLEPDFIKIPSACNNHYKMLEWLCDNYRGEIHVSLGMTTHEEEEKLIRLFETKGNDSRLHLF